MAFWGVNDDRQGHGVIIETSDDVTATSTGTARWVQRRPVRRSSTESVALEVFTLTTKAAFVSAS